MITSEQFDTALKNRHLVKTYSKQEDHTFKVIDLLRKRIPYSECHSIIIGAEHDKIYLSPIDISLQYLEFDDLAILVDCNITIGEGCLAIFV